MVYTLRLNVLDVGVVVLFNTLRKVILFEEHMHHLIHLFVFFNDVLDHRHSDWSFTFLFETTLEIPIFTPYINLLVFLVDSTVMIYSRTDNLRSKGLRNWVFILFLRLLSIKNSLEDSLVIVLRLISSEHFLAKLF